MIENDQKASRQFNFIHCLALFYFGLVNVVKLCGFYNSISMNFIPGYDTFFYLKEIQYWQQNLHGYYKLNPIFFSLFSIPLKIVGLNEMMTLKLIIVFSFICFLIGIAFIISFKKYWYIIPCILTMILHSDVLYFMSYQFIQQSTSIAFITLGLGLYLHGRDFGNKIIKSCGLLLILLGGLFHFWGLIIMIGIILVMIKNRKILLLSCIVLAGMVFLRIDKLIDLWHNLEIRFTLPWIKAWSIRWISGIEYFEYISYIMLMLMILLIAVNYEYRKRLFWGIWTMFILLLLPVWKWEFGSFALRILHSSVWVFYLALGLSIRELTMIRERYVSGGLIMLALWFMLIPQIAPTYSPLRSPSMSIECISDNQQTLKEWITEDGFVQAPHGIQFRITYFLDIASAKEMPVERSRYSKLFILDQSYPDNGYPYSIKEFPDHIPDSVKCIELEDQWYLKRVTQ